MNGIFLNLAKSSEAPPAWLGIFLVVAGLFCIWAAATDKDFFMENHKAKLIVSIFGRNGARIFYIVVGIILAIGGIAMFLLG